MKIFGFVMTVVYLFIFSYIWLIKENILQSLPYGIMFLAFLVASVAGMLREEINKVKGEDN